MALRVILVLSAILSANFAHKLDPTIELKFTGVSVENFPNPYFGDWSCEIGNPENILSAKMPIKADIPEAMMMRVSGVFEGSPLPEKELTLCEALENPTYAQDLIEAGIPKGKFPSKCPIKAGQNYEIVNYGSAKDKVLPGVPSGHFVTDVNFYEPGKDPILIVHFEGDLIHKSPQAPSLG